MTDKELFKLFEYRYSKLCRLESNLDESKNCLERYDGYDNLNLVSNHLYNVMYKEVFKNLMQEIFDLLSIHKDNSCDCSNMLITRVRFKANTLAERDLILNRFKKIFNISNIVTYKRSNQCSSYFYVYFNIDIF